MLTRATLLFSILLSASIAQAQTPIDIQPAKQLTRSNTLGTCQYHPSEKETPFFDKLADGERITGSPFVGSYRLQGRIGKYVSWFGIVRGISNTYASGNNLGLLLEQKHFDGQTDCHIMLVSASGSGDFRATLEARPDAIPALSLVKVYGKVVSEENGVPQILVEYIHVWPWLSFTFTDLGSSDDHSNPRWARFCTVCKKNAKIYNPFPTEAYYRNLLGDPQAFGLNLPLPR
jgi:hypothetical protein